MLAVRRYDAAPVQGKKKLLYSGANDRHATDAVTAATGYDEHLFAPAHLLLAEPGICMAHSVRGARQILPKIQRPLRTKAQLVGRAHERLRGDFELCVGEISQGLRETRLVAREAARAADTVATHLFRIPGSIDARVTKCLEKLRLEREGEDLWNAALACELFTRRDDSTPQTETLRVGRDRNGRHFGDRGRILLQGSAAENPPMTVNGYEVIIHRHRYHLGRTA